MGPVEDYRRGAVRVGHERAEGQWEDVRLVPGWGWGGGRYRRHEHDLSGHHGGGGQIPTGFYLSALPSCLVFLMTGSHISQADLEIAL